MPDRGGRNPSPVSAGGRLFVQGDRTLFGIDAYNGTILWFQQIPEMRRTNLPRDSSNMVATEDILYLALGDGGAGGASVNGQHPETLLASIIRIDIDSGDPYSIPADNPFADGVGGRPEVWSYGLRNPWRFSIDATDNLIYIGDVGQGSTEEINIARLVPRGHNFGWDRLEGTPCYSGACDSEGTVLPALEYSHSDGLSVTGGFVYRGLAIPELTGHYFYADWVSEWIRSFRFDGATVSDQADWTGDLQPGHVTSFGVDNEGELYITTSFSGPDGALLKIVPIR